MPEVDLFIENNSGFIVFLETKKAADGNLIVLTPAEQNLIQNYVATSPNISIKTKFLTAEPIQFQSEFTNYTLLPTTTTNPTFRYQIRINLVTSVSSRVIVLTEDQNPVTELSALTKWKLGDFGLSTQTSLVYIKATDVNSSFEVTTSVNSESNTQREAKINVLFGSIYVLRSGPDSLSEVVSLNVCTYMEQSLQVAMCD